MSKTVDNIGDIIKQFRGDERIRDKAILIAQSVRTDPRTGMADMRNFDSIAKSIYDWIVRNIHYVRDPNGIERIQTPIATMKLKTGDCDDMVILAASLLESVGIPTRIKLIGEKRGEYTHIFLEYFANGNWVSFDPTLALYPGFELPEKLIKSKKTIPIERPVLRTRHSKIRGCDPLLATQAASKRSLTRSRFLYN